jgi:hypothetical protein
MNILVFKIKENFPADQIDKVVKNITEQIENHGVVFVGPYVDVYVAHDVHGTSFDSPYKPTTEKSKGELLKEFIDKHQLGKPEE